MSRLAIVFVVGCTSTRQLADLGDARLRRAGHAEGFVVHTTEPWRERIDPNTTLRVHSATHGWSDPLHGRDLHVDDAGVWVQRPYALAHFADRIRVTGVTERVAGVFAQTRPYDGDVRRDGNAWILTAPTAATFDPWTADIELGVARLDPDDGPVCDAQRRCMDGDTARLERLRHAGNAALGTWQVHTASGWLAPVAGGALIDAIELGHRHRVGWRWQDIADIEVTNLSGGKTLGAIIGYSALAIALAPVMLVMRGFPTGGHGGSSGGGTANAVGHIGGGGGGGSQPGDWEPELATPRSAGAPALFTRWARVRSIVRMTAAVDSAITLRGDLASQGVVARLRFADVFEIGGGVRVIESRALAPPSPAPGTITDLRAWSASPTGFFQIGLHLPLDAGFRVAIPIGFEAGAGGNIASDLRLPWGVRYTSATSRWFLTLHPATPAYERRTDSRDGRWTLAMGGELGAMF